MGRKFSRGVGRRTGWIVAVCTAMIVSATYGFLVRDRKLFPYPQLHHIRTKRHPAQRATHGRHTRRVAEEESTSPESIQQLANLPYLRGYRPAAAGHAIRVYDRALAQDGLNFFTSSHAPVATLMDMDGSVVKTWTADAAKVFPGFALEKKHHQHDTFLRDAELLPDGAVVAMFDEIGIARLDADSRVLWSWRAPAHHDFCVEDTGEVWAVLHETRVAPEFRRDEPILEDFIVKLSPEGKLLRRFSLLECFRGSAYAPLLANAPSGPDVFHTNSVVVLDGRLADRSLAFRRGNLLVSIKNLGCLAVIDPEARRVVWALAGQWYGQHCARLLSNGHLLLFDNLGAMRRASRALEIDPWTQRILWSYGARPGESLLSETVGFVERLRGGNTLLTETNYGRVLEVTPDKRVAWEFVNPNRVGRNKKLIAVVYFMQRVSRDLPFLKHPRAGSPPGPPAAASTSSLDAPVPQRAD
jgi:hypothetical protein